MKKQIILSIAALLSFTSVIISCDNLPPGFSEYLTVSVDDIDYAESSSYDFGLAEAEGSGKISTLHITNNHSSPITLSSIGLSDEVNYNLEFSNIPATFDTGESTEISLNYAPQSSGVHNATLTVEIEGAAVPFEMKLTGEANYAPTVKFGISVSDAGNSAANGFYERDGFMNADSRRRPNYTKTATVNYYCYTVDMSDAWFWSIDTSHSVAYPESPDYFVEEWNFYPMVPPANNWIDNSNDAQPPTITSYDITGTHGYTNQILTANYLYFDAEGDAEAAGSVSYQWYRSSEENGNYSLIPGATSKTYTPGSDAGYYLKVQITPAAATGITAGPPVLSSPTIQISVEPLV